MRFIYSLSSIRSFFKTDVEPLICRAIDVCNVEHKDLKSLALYLAGSTIEFNLNGSRLSADKRVILDRCIDDIIPLTPEARHVFSRFHEMLMARR